MVSISREKDKNAKTRQSWLYRGGFVVVSLFSSRRSGRVLFGARCSDGNRDYFRANRDGAPLGWSLDSLVLYDSDVLEIGRIGGRFGQRGRDWRGLYDGIVRMCGVVWIIGSSSGQELLATQETGQKLGAELGWELMLHVRGEVGVGRYGKGDGIVAV